MKIFVIRHAKIYNPDKLIYGNYDIETECVKDSFYGDLANKLPNISYIYSSPLIRCKSLASNINNLIFKDFHKITYDERLKEQNFGDWEGLSWDEVSSKYSKQNEEFWRDEVNNNPPSGESYQELYSRFEGFIYELAQNHKETDKILIIAHGGIIRALSAFVQKSSKSLYQKLKESLSLEVDNLSMFEFEI